MAEELYGEIPEHLVDPAKVKAARETFDFCLDRYGSGSRDIRLKFLSRGKYDYAIARTLEGIQEIFGGKKRAYVDRGYLELDEKVDGVTLAKWTEPDRIGPLFVAVETPLERIPFVTAHEFYHARFSEGRIAPQLIAADEKAANSFGERVEREMAEEEKREADERWWTRYREVMRSK